MVLNKTKINNKNNKYNNKQQTTAASTEAVKTKQDNLKRMIIVVFFKAYSVFTHIPWECISCTNKGHHVILLINHAKRRKRPSCICPLDDAALMASEKIQIQMQISSEMTSSTLGINLVQYQQTETCKSVCLVWDADRLMFVDASYRDSITKTSITKRTSRRCCLVVQWQFSLKKKQLHVRFTLLLFSYIEYYFNRKTCVYFVSSLICISCVVRQLYCTLLAL